MKQEDDKVLVLGLCVHFVDILEILEIISNNILKTYKFTKIPSTCIR